MAKPPTDLDHRRRGWLLAALGMLLVSTDSLFVRLAEADAWDIAFLVAACSLPVQLGLSTRFDQQTPWASLRQWAAPLFAVAVMAAVSQIAFIAAITHTDVANAVVIVAAAPILAALIARVGFHERTSGRVWIAIAITLAGVMVVVAGSLGEPTLDGDLLALLAIAAFAMSINLWRRYAEMSVFVGLTLSALIMLVVAAFFASPFELDARAYFAAGAMGLVFNPLGRIAHSSAPRFAPASEVALFAPVETVAATLWAWLAFSERPSGTTVLGATIVIGGVLFGTVGGHQKRRRPSPRVVPER